MAKIKKRKVNLPKIYTWEMWIRGGSNERNKKYIGKPYTSWSQVESFRDLKGFNTGLEGIFEWIRSYLSKEKYPDMGWGYFGTAVETYITLRYKADLSDEDKEYLQWAMEHFSDEEKAVLDEIEPLGVFQYELCYYIEELDCIVLGFSDDFTPIVNNIIERLRDYKTKSKSSKEDLHLPKKHQIEIYTLAFKQYGITVKNAEYCIIERTGGRECMMGGGKESLHVGNNVWIENYAQERISEERLQETHDMLVETIIEMSDITTVYEKMVE